MIDHKNIYEAIHAVMQEVGYVQKEKKPGLNYTYAGEAALIAALRPAMVEHGIIVFVKEVRNKTWNVYQTSKGNTMMDTGLELVVTFHHVPSGTEISVMAPGEGADTGDKSGNKASTGAYKYALRQTFMIETGDDPDKYPSDEQEHGKVETPKERVWSLDVLDAVLEHTANITAEHEGAKAILDFSVLPEGVSTKTVDSWMKHWRKNYDEEFGKTKDQNASTLYAATVANDVYKTAKKGGKS